MTRNGSKRTFEQDWQQNAKFHVDPSSSLHKYNDVAGPWNISHTDLLSYTILCHYSVSFNIYCVVGVVQAFCEN